MQSLCDRAERGQWCTLRNILRFSEDAGARARCPDCARMFIFERHGQRAEWREVESCETK